MDTSPPPAGLLSQHALPTPTREVAAVTTPAAPPKHFLAAFFLSFFLGVFGADRFYLGYYISGALKFLTFGWFGIGAIVDLAVIMSGGMKDSKNRPLAGFDEYQKLAKRTVTWVTLGGAVFVIGTGVITFFAVMQAINSSGFQNILSGGTGSSSGGSSSIESQLQSGLGSSGIGL